VVRTLEQRWMAAPPKKLIGDRGYDSDALDGELKQRFGVDLIAPHRYNRSRKKTQDGRKLRCYLRRWKIERLFAWLQNFRRLVNRWEHRLSNFLGMVQLGCAAILLRYF
jgi:transposase